LSAAAIARTQPSRSLVGRRAAAAALPAWRAVATAVHRADTLVAAAVRRAEPARAVLGRRAAAGAGASTRRGPLLLILALLSRLFLTLLPALLRVLLLG